MLFDKVKEVLQKNTSALIAGGLGVGVSLVIFPLVIISINMVVKNGENKFTELEVIRVENLIVDEIDRTSRSLGDWSNWNDTYQFAENQNQEYIENNLFAETYENLDLNSIVILNSSQQIVYGEYFDDETQSITDSPIEFAPLLKAYPELADMNRPEGYKGLAFNQGYVMIVASNPILTSLNEGPPQGNIIFIKMMNKQRINHYSKITLRDIAIYSVETTIEDSPAIPAPANLKDNVFINPKNLTVITGFKYLSDLQNNSIILLQVDNDRDLYHQGRTTKVIIIVILSVLILFIAIIAFFFTRSVLNARELREEEETSAKLLESTRQNAIELEKRVVERTRELELKNKDMETFNYTVSHDLKSPLRGISGYSALLINDHANQLDATGMDYLQKINVSSQRMDQLIQDLLIYTKANRNEINRIEVDLDTLFDTLLLEYDEEISKRNIAIVKNLECARLVVDREGFTLVLRNLLDNALKFTKTNPNPKIVIGCKMNDTNVIFAISDNGVGFDLKFHEKIFDIFQRLNQAEEYPGTGIGLALVKKTMERMGGKVYAESQIGVGSTFYLEIPLVHNSK
jgi:signal transduction histidine kinase